MDEADGFFFWQFPPPFEWQIQKTKIYTIMAEEEHAAAAGAVSLRSSVATAIYFFAAC